jgi:5-methylcytosine-specific restriction endonuclease McrA
MNKKYFWTKEQLSDLYENQKLSSLQISNQLNCRKDQVLYWLHKYDIKLRPQQLFIVGHKINIGRKKSLEVKQKISKAHVGKTHTLETKEKISLTKKQTKCHVGNRNGRWIDGRNTLRHAIRHLEEYRCWIQEVFKRDKYTCQYCGDKTSGNLQAHHLIPFKMLISLFLNRNKNLDIKKDHFKLLELAKIDKEIFDIDNGITLCKNCHELTF